MKTTDICPYWMSGLVDNPIRRLFQSPYKTLQPLVHPCCSVLDFGCGPGLFSLEAGKLTGPDGHVSAVDIQPEMRAKVDAKIKKSGYQHIHTYASIQETVQTSGKVDLALAIWMLHEVKDLDNALQDIASALKPNGGFLAVEPRLHVSQQAMTETIHKICEHGFMVRAYPQIGLSYSAYFTLNG